MSTSRKTLLAGASAAAFTLMLGGAAVAASITVPSNPTTPVPAQTTDAHVTDVTAAGNSGAVDAAITDGVVTAKVGGGAQVVTTTTGNTIAANGTGDSAATSLTVNPTPPASLPLAGSDVLTPGAPGTDGIAALNLLVDTGTVNSSVENSSINQALASTSGAAGNSSNTISATTTLNTATATVAGEIPSSTDYTPGTADQAGASFTFGNAATDILTQTGVLAVANGQLSEESGPLAGSAANLGATGADSVFTTIEPTGTAVAVSTTVNQNSNALAANYTGNAATNGLSINSGDNPTFAGSASLSNSQANLDAGGTPTPKAALNEGSTISVTIKGATGADSAVFGGTLNQNLNQITSSTTGNSALGATVTAAGNALTLENGENFTAEGDQTQSNSISWTANNGLAVGTNGGLDLQSVQANDTVTGTSVLNATTSGGQVTALVQNTAANTPITLDTNTVSAASTGNDATNAIAAGGDATVTITGPLTLANAQHDDHTSITSSVDTGAEVLAQVATGTDGAIGDGTDTNVTGNTISATTFGNTATSSLTASAVTVNGANSTGGATALRADNSGEFTITAGNGVTLTNGQGVYDNGGAVVSSTVDGAAVTILAGNIGDITGDTFTNDSNTLNSTAVANGASSTLDLSGTGTLTNTTDLVNGQTSHAPVTADLTNGQVNTALDIAGGAGVVTSSPVDVSTNTLEARAWGNSASNTLSANGVTTVNLANNSAVPANTQVNVNSADGADLPFDDGMGGPVVNADNGLLSDQALDGNVEASNTRNGQGGQIQVNIGLGGTNDLTSSAVTADTNKVLSTARGNVADNTLTLGTTASPDQTFDADGEYDTVAGISNVQSVQGGVTVSATTNTNNGGVLPAPTVSVIVAGDVTSGASIDASSNTISSLAQSNSGTNALSVTSGNLVDIGTNTAVGADETSTGVIRTEAAFAVSNAQSTSSGDGVLADSRNDGVQVSIGGAIGLTDSLVTVESNTLSATATDNGANNSLALAAATGLQTTGSLINYQTSASDPQADQGLNSGTAAIPGSLGTSPTQYSFTAEPVITDANGNPYSATIGGTVTNYLYSGYLETTDAVDAAAAGWTEGTGGLTGDYFKLVSDYSTGTTYPEPATQLTFSGSYGGSGPTSGTNATPGTGVSVILTGNIDPSSIQVTGNKGLATSTGNNASNSLIASAGTTAQDELGNTPTAIGAVSTVGATTTQTASGTFSEENVQTLASTADVGATNFFDTSVNGTTTTSALVTASQVNISSNTANATAEGNVAGNSVAITATNSLTVTGTSQAVSGSLLSAQVAGSTAGVIAQSTDTVAGPGQLSAGSVLTMNSNTNTSLARTNDASSSLSAIAGAELDSAYGGLGTASATVTGFGTSFGFSAAADFAVNNIQYASSGPTVADATTTISQSDSSIAGGVDASTASLNLNTSTAESDANNAATTLTLGAGTALAASGALLNDQSSSVTSTAHNITGIGFTEPEIVDTSSVTENNNTAGSTANGNNATNLITASGSSISGVAGATGAGSTLAFGSTYEATASYALSNVQALSSAATVDAINSLTATIDAPTGTPSEVDISDSVASVSNNAASAWGEGNQATSTIQLNAGDALSTTASIQSLQQAPNNGGAGPNITGQSTSEISGPGLLLDGSTLNLDTNTNIAAALANNATNTLNVAASTTLGTITTDTQATASSTPDAIFGFSNTADADYSIGNVQQYGLLAAGGDVEATAHTTVNQSGDSTTGIVNGTASLSTNTAQSEAVSNLATSALGLTGTNGVSATGALANLQLGEPAIDTASSTLQVGYAEPQASDSSITADSNKLTALAQVNSAKNNLTVTGADIANTTATPSNTAEVNNTGVASAAADYALSNTQVADSTDLGATGNLSVVVSNSFNGGALSNTPVNLNLNTGTAESDGNYALNNVALNATTNLTSSAALTNAQTNGAASTASMNGTVEYTWPSLTGGATYAISNSAVTINGNTSAALASGNTASNALNAGTTDQYTTTAPATSTTSTTASLGPQSAAAQYAALNDQSNTADVLAENTTNIGAVLNTTGATTGVSVTNSPISVSNNTILAQGYGNNATTSITLSPVLGNMPSAALTSAQSNSASVTSTVTSSVIQIGSPISMTASVATATGNTINANATGNAATSHISVGH
jgi:hypothetical protein